MTQRNLEQFSYLSFLTKKISHTTLFQVFAFLKDECTSIFSKSEWICSPCVLKRERSCRTSNVFPISLTEGHVCQTLAILIIFLTFTTFINFDQLGDDIFIIFYCSGCDNITIHIRKGFS